MDADNGHSVDRQEFRSAVTHLGLGLTMPQADELVKAFDLDNSGHLDAKEFCDAMYEVFGPLDKPSEHRGSQHLAQGKENEPEEKIDVDGKKSKHLSDKDHAEALVQQLGTGGTGGKGGIAEGKPQSDHQEEEGKYSIDSRAERRREKIAQLQRERQLPVGSGGPPEVERNEYDAMLEAWRQLEATQNRAIDSTMYLLIYCIETGRHLCVHTRPYL